MTDAWTAVEDDAGHVYYWREDTDEVRWHRPLRVHVATTAHDERVRCHMLVAGDRRLITRLWRDNVVASHAVAQRRRSATLRLLSMLRGDRLDRAFAAWQRVCTQFGACIRDMMRRSDAILQLCRAVRLGAILTTCHFCGLGVALQAWRHVVSGLRLQALAHEQWFRHSELVLENHRITRLLVGVKWEFAELMTKWTALRVR